ncbi:lymphocyte antigen 6D-like [Rhynchocyon petersi]
MISLGLFTDAVDPAWALQCHVCASSSNCKEPHLCPQSSHFCKTLIIVESLSGNLVRKECADFCLPNQSQQGQVGSGSVTTMCCQGDLCNASLNAASPLSRTTLGLALALGFLALVLAPSL